MTVQEDKTVEEQMDLISVHSEELISQESLRDLLSQSRQTGRPLRVKQGIDPTSPDVHIGHMVPYRLMRAFQDCGHTAVLVIGDVTAQIGDPTDRDSERSALDAETVRHNAIGYVEKIFRVVDRNRAEVHRQSDWYDSMNLPDVIRLLSSFSVAGMLSHETFRARLDAGARLSVHELVYPALQAMDSVHLRADVEIGGSDQKFNMLCGRDLQRQRGQSPQCILTTPLLPGTDGRKMSKSLGNHIPVDADPEEMYGKVMSLPDELMPVFYRLASGLDPAVVRGVVQELRDASVHPRSAKARLASAVVALYHGPNAAHRAATAFDSVFTEKKLPGDIPEFVIANPEMPLVQVLRDAGLVDSLSQGRRLIVQGAVRLGSKKLLDPDRTVSQIAGSRPSVDLRVGKRRFLRLLCS